MNSRAGAGLVLLLLLQLLPVSALGWQDWYAEGAVLDLNTSLIVSAGPGTEPAGAWTTAVPEDVSGSQLQLRVMSADWSAVESADIVIATEDGFGEYIQIPLKPLLVAPQPGEWLQVTVPRSSWLLSAAADPSTVSGLVFRVTAAAGSTALAAVSDVQFVTRRAARGVITLAFDDGRKDVITKAFPLLQERGLTGTAYVIPELIGRPGFMDQQDLYVLHGAGWEIAAHGEHPLIFMTEREIRRHFRFAREWLSASGFTENPGYAYPNGLYNERVRDLTAEHFSAGRTINARSDLLGYAPRYELGALSVWPELAPTELARLAETAVDNGEWLSLVFHLLSDEPVVDTQYRVADFEALLDEIVLNDWPVLTAADAWQLSEDVLLCPGPDTAPGAREAFPGTVPLSPCP